MPVSVGRGVPVGDPVTGAVGVGAGRSCADAPACAAVAVKSAVATATNSVLRMVGVPSDGGTGAAFVAAPVRRLILPRGLRQLFDIRHNGLPGAPAVGRGLHGIRDRAVLL